MSKENEIEQGLAIELVNHPAFKHFQSKVIRGHKSSVNVISMTDNQLSRVYSFESGVNEFFRYVEAVASDSYNPDDFSADMPFDHYGENTPSK